MVGTKWNEWKKNYSAMETDTNNLNGVSAG